MITIHEEQQDDLATIRRIHELAFGGSAEALLVDRLRARGELLASLVAEDAGRLRGHIAFSAVTLDGPRSHGPGAGLAPMAVLPEHQKEGIGSLLVRAGLDRCRLIGMQWIVVLGHADYYPRFGFVPASRYGIRCIYDVPDEVFMVQELHEGALQGASGTIRYAPAFDEL